jgi:hypothetical protein
MNKHYKLFLAATISALFLFLVWYKSGIYFETNDDRYTASILSGVITGSPNAHVSNINYILSLPLSILYRISGHMSLSIPWYGMTLIAFHWLAYAAVLYGAYLNCKNAVQISMMTCMAGTFFLSYYYMQGQIQYTSTAMLLAMAGYFCLMMYRDYHPRRGFVLFFVLELLGYLLRRQAMLIVQPMGIAFAGCLILISCGESVKARFQTIAKVGIVLAAVGIIGAVGNLAEGKYSGELKVSQEFDDCRVKLFDYYGKPDYMEVKEILDKYQVSEKGYRAYLNYTVFHNNVTLECERELVRYAAQKTTGHLQNAIAGIKSIYTEDYQWKINRFSLYAFLFLLILILVYRRYGLLIPGIGLAAAQVFTWGVLFYRGRVLLRVTVPVFACGALLAMALSIKCVCGKDGSPEADISYAAKQTGRFQTIVQGTILAVCCALLLLTGFSSARQQYRYIREANEGQRIFMEGMREIIAYCEQQEENRYVLEAVSMGNYKGSALESNIYHPSNYVFSGGWFSNLPDVIEHMDTYLEEGKDIYLIIFSDGNESSHPSVQYLEEYTGRDAKCVDTIETSPGGNYTVYCF